MTGSSMTICGNCKELVPEALPCDGCGKSVCYYCSWHPKDAWLCDQCYMGPDDGEEE
jgi:hypothetical protein